MAKVDADGFVILNLTECPVDRINLTKIQAEEMDNKQINERIDEIIQELKQKDKSEETVLLMFEAQTLAKIILKRNSRNY